MESFDSFDKEKIDYIIQHKGSCGGGICSACPITKIRGTVAGCSNDVSLQVAKDCISKISKN